MDHKYYLEHFSLLPVGSNKIPTEKWKKYQTEKPTIEQVESWLKLGKGLGLITGELSGIDVVDDDRAKHDLTPWKIDSPVIAQSPSGGKHYYFKHANNQRNTTNAKIFIDIRGEGGYVRLPPSFGYKWIKPPTEENLQKLQPIPDDLVKIITPVKSAGETVKLAEVIKKSPGDRDSTLLKAADSLCARISPGEWEATALPILEGINQTYDPPLPPNDLIRIFNQAQKFIGGQKSLKEQTTSEMAIQRASDRQIEKTAPNSGYEDINLCYTPLVPGRLCVLTGDTNIGKTAFCCNLVHRVTQQGKKVIYFALEPDRALIDYLVSISLNKKFYDITDDDIRNYKNPLLTPVTSDGVRGLDNLEKIIKSKERQDLIVIDHIGYFVNSKTSNFYNEQGETLKRLALLAQSKMTHILAVAHLNKTFDATPDKWIPTMNQIAGAAAFKQDADDVLILARKPVVDNFGHVEYEQGGEGVILIGKTKSPKQKSLAPLVFHAFSGLITGRTEQLEAYSIKQNQPTEDVTTPEELAQKKLYSDEAGNWFSRI